MRRRWWRRGLRAAEERAKVRRDVTRVGWIVLTGLFGCGQSQGGAGDGGLGDATSAADSAPGDGAATDSGVPEASGSGLVEASAPDAARPGFALRFDDSVQPQYVLVPDAARLNLTSAFTVEAWVNMSGPGHASAATILARPYGSSGGDTAALLVQQGNLYAGVDYDWSAGAAALAWDAQNSTWVHVAWTFDREAESEVLYAGETQVAQHVSVGELPLYDGHSLVIGANVGLTTFTNGFAGTIDDVRIYAGARRADQIAADATSASPLGDPTLVAYYTFDEGFGNVAHDASPNHFDGMLGDGTNAASVPVWVPSTAPFGAPVAESSDAGVDAAGRVALEFDITNEVQYVAVSDDDGGMRLGDAATYEAWIAVNGVASGTMSVFAKPYGARLQSSVGLWLSADYLNAGVNVGGVVPLQALWPYENGPWHHVALTYDMTSGAQRLYIDGALVASFDADGDLDGGAPPDGAPPIGPILFDSHPFYIGAAVNYDLPPGLGFNGLIEDVWIFSIARSPEAIKQDYATGPVADETLFAHYTFDEGTGAVARDQTQRHDGTLGSGGVSAPVWVVNRPPH
jgi:hypothetical protein